MKDKADPLVSIIIPTYNRQALIMETLQSVQNQTYQNWECIVVDDGSIDTTMELVQKMAAQDQRFRIFKREDEPKGACTCRNIGLLQSKGDFVIFLDSDDLLAPFCLAQRVLFLKENPMVDMAIFPQLIFREIPGDNNTLINIPTEENALNRFFTFEFCMDVPWVNSAPVIRRQSLIKKNIRWDTKVKGYQDIAFHVECLLRGLHYQFATAKPDYYYRMHQADRIGKKIFSAETMVSTETMLFNFYQQLQSATLLTEELRLRMIKSFFYGLIENWIRLRNPQKARKVVREMLTRKLIQYKMYFHVLLYIFFRTTALKKLGPKINRIFFPLWKDSIYKKTECFYLRCQYN